jgi:hypothetical protein
MSLILSFADGHSPDLLIESPRVAAVTPGIRDAAILEKY